MPYPGANIYLRPSNNNLKILCASVLHGSKTVVARKHDGCNGCNTKHCGWPAPRCDIMYLYYI